MAFLEYAEPKDFQNSPVMVLIENMLLREIKQCSLKSKNPNSFFYLPCFYMLATKQEHRVVL